MTTTDTIAMCKTQLSQCGRGASTICQSSLRQIANNSWSSHLKSDLVKPGQTKKSMVEIRQYQITPTRIKPKSNRVRPKNRRSIYGNAIHCFNLKSRFANTCPSSVCIHPIQKSLLASNCVSTICKAKQAKRPQKKSRIFSGHFYVKSLANPTKTITKTMQICAKNPRFLTCFFRNNLASIFYPLSAIAPGRRSLGEGGLAAADQSSIFALP